MPSPSWDPVIGTLGGVLDPKIIISRISTEWSRRQGLSTDKKNNNVVFQTGTRPSIKCDNCERTGHTKTRCWAKGGGQEGQYPEWYKGKKDPKTSNTVKAVSDTQIIWAYRSRTITDVWYADSATTVHVSPNRGDFTTYHKFKKSRAIKAFRNNKVEAIGEGDIFANVHYDSKTTRIRLTRVMHVPRANGKILSLKVLDQKGFESRIMGGCVKIMKDNIIYAEALLGGELYEVMLNIIPSKENVMTAVKRDDSSTDLSTWHRWLGHIGETMLKRMVNSQVVKGMTVTDMTLSGIREDCILGKMDEKTFSSRDE